MAPRHWMPVGSGEFVTMDAKRAYTGDHSPVVQLSRTEARGIQQAGLAVRKGKAYAGRVVLAGTAGTVVKVNLVWGKTDGERHTDAVSIGGTGYKKYPLQFVAQADADERNVVFGERCKSDLGARNQICTKSGLQPRKTKGLFDQAHRNAQEFQPILLIISNIVLFFVMRYFVRIEIPYGVIGSHIKTSLWV